MKLPWSKDRKRKELTEASSFGGDVKGVSNPIFIALSVIRASSSKMSPL